MIAINSSVPSRPSQSRLAIKDMIDGSLGTSIWLQFAWQDIKQRYRRSIIGPLWITISMGVMVGAMGPLYGTLLNQPKGSYFQYLATSLVIWSFISGQIVDACTAFIAAEGFIKEVKMPLTVHLLRGIVKNIIIFGHNFLIVALVLLFYPPAQFKTMLVLPISLFLLMLNLSWIAFLLSTLTTRFRDITQTVASIMQMAFFLTPVVWNRNVLTDSGWVADANILFHYMEIIRAPLLGHYPPTLTWVVVSVVGVFGWVITFFLFARFRSRIPYWI